MSGRRGWLSALGAMCAISFLVVGLATDAGAQRRGRGGAGLRGGGISRGGPASGGSLRSDRAGGSYRSYQPGSRPTQQPTQSGAIAREGSFETRRGETIDYSGTITRDEQGIQHEGSWQSSSGASGSGSGSIAIEGGQVQGRERTGHVENAAGETLDRSVQSERHGEHVDREGEVRTSTGIDAETKGRLAKADEGFVAQGAISGKQGTAAGSVVRKGDQTVVRGAASDGKYASWGRIHCNGSHCTGGRVTVKVKDYYAYPYYYYPYYYGWYSCPYGSARVWTSPYGAPIYGCSNVYVVHTTISLGPTESGTKPTASKAPASSAWASEAEVSSQPVLMYEVGPDVVAYATHGPPAGGIYAEEQDDRYFWLLGPTIPSKKAKEALAKARAMSQPTANAALILYTVGAASKHVVFLTNERPFPGIYTQPADELFAWIPGVEVPTAAQKDLLREVVAAHEAGGRKALDREVRKLEVDRGPPPVPEPKDQSKDEPEAPAG